MGEVVVPRVKKLPTAPEYKAQIRQLQHWDELRSLWRQIQDRDTPGWESGKAFEYLIIRAFELDGADVKYPYSVPLNGRTAEQIDGVIHTQGLSYLVESKDFTDELVNIEPIAKLAHKIQRRPMATMGLVFSRTGFTLSALDLCQYSSPKTILLWNGREIEYALKRESICALLTLKYRVCVESGLPDYDVTEDKT